MTYGHVVRHADTLLRQWIKSSSIQAGTRLPSERELAKILEVQSYGVNRAMAKLVSEGLVERKGYKLFLAAANSKTELFSCDVVVSRRSMYIQSYRRVAREVGAQVAIHLWESAEEAVLILNRLAGSQSQGVIFAPPSESSTGTWEKAAKQLLANGIPFLCVGQPSIYVPSILTDDDQALETIFRYLMSEGHREFALMTPAPWAYASSGIISQWGWLCEKYGLHESKERIARVSGTRFIPEEIRKLARSLSMDWKSATALVVYTDTDYPAQHLLIELKKCGLLVPDKLSIVFVGDAKALHSTTPSITATAVDVPLLHETAYLLLRRAQRKFQDIGVLPKSFTIRLQQELIVRESTGPAPGSLQSLSAAAKTPAMDGSNPDPAETMDFYTAWHRPYDMASKAPESHFAEVDLRSLVNRPLSFRRGWLGDLPLKNIEPGRNVIHGIPFEILGGNTRNDNGGIVFQSMMNTVGSGKKLPQNVKVHVNVESRAIYILHGCGYSNFRNQFATYSFFNGKSKIAEVPLIAYGRPDPGLSQEERARVLEECNIQDWWTDYPHYNFPHARFAPIVQEHKAESVHRHVYLYTLEWINPTPEKVVTHIEITTDCEQSTTLGVLSISVLRH